MSHYARVIDGIVEKVIVADADYIALLPDSQNWIQTSYNTRRGKHVGPDGTPDGGTPLRGNFAGVGWVYDAENDVFYEPKPYPTAVLNKETWTWDAIPVTIME